MAKHITADQRSLAVASRQAGAIAHRQARRAGLSDDQILHRVASGAWIRRLRGLSVVAGSSDTPLQRLWIAYLAAEASDGIVSHLSAAAMYGLLAFPPLPHVTVPRTASVGSRVAKVHRGSVPIQDRVRREGIAVTNVSRTIADCASLLDRPSFERLVDVAFCRKLATADSVEGAAERAGRRRHGSVLLAQTIACWTPDIEPGSPAEMRLLRFLGELGLTGVVTQFVVRGKANAFVARLDVAVPELCFALEYDGVEPHGPRAWTRDEPRSAGLRRLGWRVESVTKADLLPGETRLRRLVAAATR